MMGTDLDSSHRRYIATETAVSVAVNVVISVIMVFVVNRGRTAAPVAGAHGLLLDMVPQTFMVSFMSVLMATLLTRRRRRSAVLLPLSGPSPRLPQHAVLRALLAALFVTIIAVPILIMGLPARTPLLSGIWHLLGFNIAYAALLAILITPPALRAALRDPVATS